MLQISMGTPLHVPSANGRESVARLLLDKGAKVEAANKEYNHGMSLTWCNF